MFLFFALGSFKPPDIGKNLELNKYRARMWGFSRKFNPNWRLFPLSEYNILWDLPLCVYFNMEMSLLKWCVSVCVRKGQLIRAVSGDINLSPCATRTHEDKDRSCTVSNCEDFRVYCNFVAEISL